MDRRRAALILLMVGCSGSSGRSASTAVPAREPTRPALTHYVNPLLKIEMDIPIGWIVDPANDTVIGGVSTRYLDPTGRTQGYIDIDAAAALNLDNAIDAQAHHKLRPYGQSPLISAELLAAGPATLILPDPSSPQIHDAALVMAIPQVQIGGTAYGFLVLYGAQRTSM